MSTSFSAPVNMADSMENVSSWTVSGSKEGMEVSKDSKDLLKCGIQNIVQYSAANDPFPAFFPPTFTSIHTICHVYRCGPPEKLSLALVAHSYILRIIAKLTYCQQSSI